jgi:short chain dehydrogenase
MLRGDLIVARATFKGLVYGRIIFDQQARNSASEPTCSRRAHARKLDTEGRPHHRERSRRDFSRLRTQPPPETEGQDGYRAFQVRIRENDVGRLTARPERVALQRLRDAREGAKVMVASRTKSTVDSVVAEIQAEGGTALGIACDVGRRNDVYAMVARTVSSFATVDILVNNAQGFGTERRRAPTPLPTPLETSTRRSGNTPSVPVPSRRCAA